MEKNRRPVELIVGHMAKASSDDVFCLETLDMADRIFSAKAEWLTVKIKKNCGRV